MRTVTRYLTFLGVFALVLGTVYWLLTHEWTGAVLLWFLALMPLVVAAFALRHRSSSVAAEDDPDANAQDPAGEILGSFPMSTVWPVFLVLGVLVTGAGVIYGLILVPAGFALMGWAVLGLMRESRG